jgi:YidC/Oxa1 family membrane protein insertase
MDFQKIILWIAIAAVSVMLINEWQAFKEEKTAVVNSTQTAAMPSKAAPNIVSNNGDLPQMIQPGSDAVDVSTSVSQLNLITVETDLLRVVIDTEGGDIVEVDLLKHKDNVNNPDSVLRLLQNDQVRTYIAQSGLIGPNGTDTNEGRPTFVADESSYALGNDDELNVDMSFRNDAGVLITKRYTFRRDSYVIDQTYLINNMSEAPWQAALFGQIKRDSSKDPSASDSGMGMRSFLGIAATTDEERYKKLPFKDIAEEPFKAMVQGGWIAMSQHYFLSAWIPNQNSTNNFGALVSKSGLNIARFTMPMIEVAPGQQGQTKASLYVGPKDQYRLEKVAENLDLTVDYGWLWWIAQPLFWIMIMIHKFVPNWGLTIILLTIFVKSLFFKLSAASYESMANMRRVTPKLNDIKERYADDKQKQSQMMMELYKKEKINPMGGCLPIFIQMPVFISLYWVLMESVEIRHAPFFAWIQDLSAMDPYYILPLIMGVSMFAQQKLSPQAFTDPMQQKIMQYMPVMFTFFFLWFPSGLVLYWVVNNVLSIAQQYVITKRIEAKYSTASK